MLKVRQLYLFLSNNLGAWGHDSRLNPILSYSNVLYNQSRTILLGHFLR
ncbi:protein of unknown function [Candidatus Nitrosocosmicus franklandus]|uniref:Uncharacterized protein n=1 Tax=Candidatus Nitrosocosmicus franklandianus TaxID=1798806 RepID=A0A484I8W7_9ARCH|nr:protein of unknown function [Candidatus Nitrosocosmicus franklandus]